MLELSAYLLPTNLRESLLKIVQKKWKDLIEIKGFIFILHFSYLNQEWLNGNIPLWYIYAASKAICEMIDKGGETMTCWCYKKTYVVHCEATRSRHKITTCAHTWKSCEYVPEICCSNMSWHENWYFNYCATPIDCYRSKFKNKENWMNMFIHFFCLCQYEAEF